MVHPNGANSNKASTYAFYVHTNAEVSNVTERCCQGSINHIKNLGIPNAPGKRRATWEHPDFFREGAERGREQEGRERERRRGRERQRERNPEGQRGRKAKKDKREKDKEPWLARQNSKRPKTKRGKDKEPWLAR